MAMVVYTGLDTKLEQNLGKYSFKLSRTDRTLQKGYFVNALCILFFMVLSVIGSYVMNNRM